jgi:hypothetical protein
MDLKKPASTQRDLVLASLRAQPQSGKQRDECDEQYARRWPRIQR